MDKVFIKDVPSFCRMNRQISGVLSLEIKQEHSDGNKEIQNLVPDQVVQVQYQFEGTESFEGKFYLKGSWSADVQLMCSYCCEPLTENIMAEYPALMLVSEKEDPLAYEEDCHECRFDYFDLKPWLYSELMVMVPISPKHSSCTIS